jgi:hypothetical protein
MTGCLSHFLSQYKSKVPAARSQCPRGLRPGPAAARLLELRVRILPGAWMSVSHVSVVCCQVEVSVVCLSVIVKPRQLRALAHWGLSRHWKKRRVCSTKCSVFISGMCKSYAKFRYSIQHVTQSNNYGDSTDNKMESCALRSNNRITGSRPNKGATRRQGSGEDYIRRNLMTCTRHQILFG